MRTRTAEPWDLEPDVLVRLALPGGRYATGRVVRLLRNGLAAVVKSGRYEVTRDATDLAVILDKNGEPKRAWIGRALQHHKEGALHRQLGVRAGKRISARALARAAKAGGKLGKRARLAQTLRKMSLKKRKKGER